MWRNDKGNVSIIVALCMPMVIGGAAFGIETGYWRYDQVRLQQAADAAAYAGAVVKRAGGSTISNSAVTDAATSAATTDGYTTATDTITVNLPSTATPGDANSVEAVITRTEPPIFTAYIRCFVAKWQNAACSNSMATVKVSSTASFSNAGDACILALSPNAAKATDFAGNSSLTLNGCTVMANSIAANAFNVQGSAILSAPCAYSAGGDSLGGTVTLTTCGAVKTHQPPVADPYASYSIPATPSGNCKNQGNGAVQAGTLYCGLDFKNTKVLSAGTYFVGSQGLSFEANADITCSGCTFVLTNGGGVSMNGNSHVNLSAPISGADLGMLFVSARDNTGTITINGDNSTSMTGVIYAPDAQVSYLGNFSGVGGCTQIVSSTVQWSGNTTFADNCSNYFSPVKVGSVVRLSA